jgi:hypothetical protein
MDNHLCTNAVMTEAPGRQGHRLISGIFSPEEANTVLMNLLEDKITFHRRNIWSRQERFGQSDPASEKRIRELQQTKSDIAKLLAEAASSGTQLSIRCDIDITPAG